jgi:hypothetical protein
MWICTGKTEDVSNAAQKNSVASGRKRARYLLIGKMSQRVLGTLFISVTTLTRLNEFQQELLCALDYHSLMP